MQQVDNDIFTNFLNDLNPNQSHMDMNIALDYPMAPFFSPAINNNMKMTSDMHSPDPMGQLNSYLDVS